MFTNKYKTTIILIGFKKYKTLNSPCNRVDRIVKIIAIIFNMKNNLEGLGTQNILNLRQNIINNRITPYSTFWNRGIIKNKEIIAIANF